MDDTQRLRIYRPDEEDLLDASMGQTDSTRLDDNVLQVNRTSGNSACEATSMLPVQEPVTDMNSGPAGILTQASGLLRRFMLFTGYSVACCWLTGCTALHPLHGIPVRQLPREFRGPSRANMETIDLSRLSQTPQAAHIVDSGDLLGIYIYGILGKIDETPPVYVPQNGDGNPTIGLPIPVRDDGTISLPQIPPLYVRGMTVRQTEEAVRREYVQRRIREAGSDILVSLQRSRTYKVTVLRQETPNPAITGLAGGGIQLGATKRGTGQLVTLPAGENDVLRALTLSGGLPGLDAQNAIYVLRRPRPVQQVPLAATLKRSGSWPAAATSNPHVVLTSQHCPSQSPFRLSGRKNSPSQGQFILVGHSLPFADATEDTQQYTQLEGQEESLSTWNGPAMQTASRGRNDSRAGYSDAYRGRPAEYQPMSDSQAEPFADPEAIDRPYDQLNPNLEAPEQLPIVADGNRHIPPELQPYMMSGGQVFRIPVRLRPGEQAFFNERDILLFDGDIIFIESRDTEIFYTGGLLGGGQFSLPRDYDLDVIDAISIAQGRGTQVGGANQLGGIASVNQDISVSASNLVIIRRLNDGRRVNIKIDVNKALRDENENLLVQPGDHLILRYTPIEAVGAFIERNLLAGSLIGVATQATTFGAGK